MKKIQSLRIISILLFVLLFSLHDGYALFFRNISVINGLGNRRVFSAAVDHKGYMWFATRVSIDRYNGEVFEHYNLSKYGDNFRNRGVIADNRGHIVTFTQKYIYRYNEETDDFTQYKIADLFTPRLENTHINALHFDSDNRLWVATTSGLFYSSDFTTWESVPCLKKTPIYSLTNGARKDLWIGTETGIYHIYKGGKKGFVCRSSAYSTLAKSRIQSLYFDVANKKMWIGSFSQGLFLHNIELNSLRKISNTSTPIRTICKAPNAEMWIGTDGDGIFAFHQKSGTLIAKHSQTQEREGQFESNSIYHILNDESRIWVSTYSGGVMVCNYKTISNNTYTHLKDNSNSLFNNHVNAVIEDSENNLWFGTNSGISKFDRKNNRWNHLFTENNITGNVVILALHEDKSGNIWAGGFATDLYCISKNGAIKVVKSPLQGDKKNYIYSIIEDKEGRIWYGGNITKLTCYNPANNSFSSREISGINNIVEYEENGLLVATLNGLYRVDKEKNRMTLFDFSKVDKYNKTFNAFINCALVDPNDPNQLWLGFEGGGIYHYNLETNHCSIINTNNGLSSNYIYGLLQDDYDRLWISTESGLNCYNRNNNNIESFFEPDGLPDNTLNFLAYTKCRNGNMVWGTPKGAVEIVPEDIKRKSLPNINLRFTSFNLFNQRVLPNEANSPLKKSIDDTETLQVSYGQRSFSFEFLDLNYSTYAQTNYSWKLEGFDKDWSKLSREHKAVYTNVPPGIYVFKVKAVSIGNTKESVIRRIEVTVLTPFWLSPLAILVYMILSIILIYFVHNYLRNKIETKNSEEKIRFFVNMAHDVRTPIALVKAPLNEIEHEKLSEEGKSALALAQKNLDKLFSLVTQLLDFQRIESDAVKLAVEETDINSFMQSIFDSFMIPSKEKQIKLQFEPLPEEAKVWIDRKKITLCCENLLSNAIKYTNNGGTVKMKFSIENNTLSVEVSDNGIGIPTKDQKSLFERFYRAENVINSKETGSGIGLMLTKKLVIMHKGRINFTSVERGGTTFTIEIPCLANSYSSDELIEKHERTELIEKENLADIHHVKILLVEDNDEMRDYLSRQLKRQYHVIDVSDAEKAVKMLKQELPDFILSDIMMPGMSGFDFCAMVKKDINTCHIPVILLSSLSDRTDIVRGLNVGADDYITKPFDLAVLESKIKTIIKNRVLFKRKYIEKTAKMDEFATINNIDKAFMSKVIKLVEDNLSNEQFSIDSLALEMAMSRSVFYKKLKALTNDNPKDLVKEIKMRKAAEYLRENKLPINEIAYLTGFPNSKYFSTAFKKYFGVTPSHYVENHDAGNTIYDEKE